MEVLSKKLKSVRVCDVWPVGLFFIEVADIEALGHVVIYSYFIKTRFDGGSTKTPQKLLLLLNIWTVPKTTEENFAGL